MGRAVIKALSGLTLCILAWFSSLSQSYALNCKPLEPKGGANVNELGSVDHPAYPGDQHRDEGRDRAEQECRSRHIGDDAAELID